MGEYILVEKDAKVMQKCWKWLIIFLLVTIAFICLMSSYAISALADNFNGNYVPGSVLEFKTFPSITKALTDTTKRDTEFYSHKVDKLYNEFKHFYLSKDMREKDDTEAVPKTQVYQFVSNIQSPTIGTTERASMKYMTPTINDSDADFFKNYQIDEMKSNWGSANTYSLYFFFPVIEITVAVVWIAFIAISRRVGERKPYTVIHKAWRLVIPAVVTFAVFTILCAIYAAYLNSHLNNFCDQFKQKFSNEELPCQLLLERFSMSDSKIFSTSTNYNMAKSVAYIRIFMWLLAGFVMLMRCILGADFEMHESEHCTEQLGTAFDPQNADHPSRVKFIDDGIRRYSRERVYKPTTTELQPLD